MALRPPVPGLRQMHNKSNDVAKVSLVIPAGDPITVSEYVAGQLGSAFADGLPAVTGDAASITEATDADTPTRKPRTRKS